MNLIRDAAAIQGIINLIYEAIVIQQRAILGEESRRRGRKRKDFWVRPWLAVDRRLLYGQYATLMYELRAEDTSSFFQFYEDGACYV